MPQVWSSIDERRAYHRKYEAAHRDELNAKSRRRYAEHAEERRAVAAAYRAANPEKIKAAAKKSREKTKETRAIANAAWYAANRDRRRDQQFKRRYGVSLEEVGAMMLAQGERCAICGSVMEPGTGMKPVVDHDHGTGAVRAMLCDPCNRGLGQFSDSLIRLRQAVEYLEKWNCRA